MSTVMIHFWHFSRFEYWIRSVFFLKKKKEHWEDEQYGTDWKKNVFKRELRRNTALFARPNLCDPMNVYNFYLAHAACRNASFASIYSVHSAHYLINQCVLPSVLAWSVQRLSNQHALFIYSSSTSRFVLYHFTLGMAIEECAFFISRVLSLARAAS